MKRFDKGYIYASLLTDLFYCLLIVFALLKDVFFDEEADAAVLLGALLLSAILFLVLYLCFLGYRILYYKTSGYELAEKEIRCQRGVLFRKRSVLDYTRVHAINKKQNIIQRLFGIAVLTVDSGSANTAHRAEITIIEKATVVDALLDELNSLKETGPREAFASFREEVLLTDKDSLYRFTSGKKLLYTLINMASAAGGTAFFALAAGTVLGVCKAMLKLDALGTWGQYFLYAALITVGGMLLISLISLLGSILHSFLGYYNFTIKKHEGSLRISYGLLEKHTNTFRYDRIKAVKISQGLVQRLLGFASIKLEVIGYMSQSGDDNGNADLGVLVPFCKYEEIGPILEAVLPEYAPSEKQTSSVAFFPFLSWFLLFFCGITGITLAGAVAVMAVLSAPPRAIAAVVLATLGAALTVIAIKALGAVLGYRTAGLAVCGDKLTAYSGGFTKTVTVFFARHLVAVERVTTPLREKHGIAGVVMHLKTNEASNEVRVPIQRDTLSEEIAAMLTE